MRELMVSLMLLCAAIGSHAQIMYKVSGNGAKGDSYVLGTHHFAPITILDSIKGFDAAIESVDAVIGEVVMHDMSTAETQQKMMSMAMAPADSTLTQVLTAEQLDSINGLLAKYTGGMITTQALNTMKPAMVTQQIVLFMTMKALPGFNPMQQLDTHVQQLGEGKGKEIMGFETVEFQLNLLLGAPIAKQAEELLEVIRKESKTAALAVDLTNAYMAQDIDLVCDIMYSPDAGMGDEAQKAFLVDRNEDWANQLSAILPQKSVLICVGAGHLPGEKGLLNLLRQAGYIITPVY